LLEAVLWPQGFDVVSAGDGTSALAILAQRPVDTVLLDVMMPGLDGFEVCRRIKAEPATAYVPVILVTALRDREDRLRGIAAGATDFVSKPIDADELALRVRNAVGVKRLHDNLREKMAALEQLEQQRDSLVHMVVHDMRSPLTGLLGMLQLLDNGARKVLDDRQRHYMDSAGKAGRAIRVMIENLLAVSKLEQGQLKPSYAPHDLCVVVRSGIDMLGAASEGRRVLLEAPSVEAAVECDGELIERVVTNLVSNALKFTPKEQPVCVSVSQTPTHVRVSVIDSGPGIPREFHAKVFEKFGQVEMRRQSSLHATGLGLTFCKLAVEVHGGTIGLDSAPGSGSTFWFELPRVRP
jgi:signal transduction histidine kinase